MVAEDEKEEKQTNLRDSSSGCYERQERIPLATCEVQRQRERERERARERHTDSDRDRDRERAMQWNEKGLGAFCQHK